VNTIGDGSWPVSPPLRPMAVLPPFAAITPFHEALATVAARPVRLKVPFQPEATVSPAAGQVQASVQAGVVRA
jgi:hypothetical protein